MKINRDITINAPAALITSFLTEPELLKLWIKTMSNYHNVSTPPNGDYVGSKHMYDAGGKTFEQTIIKFVPEREFKSGFECSDYAYEDEFYLNELNGRTRVTGQCRVTFKTLKWKLTGLFLGFAIRIDFSNNMNLLKDAVENKSEQDATGNPLPAE